MISVDKDERAAMRDIVTSILLRHRDGALADPRARSAIAAFVTSYAPEDAFDEASLMDFDVYLDITLQLSKRAPTATDGGVAERVENILQIALGDSNALRQLAIAA